MIVLVIGFGRFIFLWCNSWNNSSFIFVEYIVPFSLNMVLTTHTHHFTRFIYINIGKLIWNSDLIIISIFTGMILSWNWTLKITYKYIMTEQRYVQCYNVGFNVVILVSIIVLLQGPWPISAVWTPVIHGKGTQIYYFLIWLIVHWIRSVTLALSSWYLFVFFVNSWPFIQKSPGENCQQSAWHQKQNMQGVLDNMLEICCFVFIFFRNICINFVSEIFIQACGYVSHQYGESGGERRAFAHIGRLSRPSRYDDRTHPHQLINYLFWCRLA